MKDEGIAIFILHPSSFILDTVELFNWPIIRIAYGLFAAFVGVIGPFAILAWRAAILRKLGIRNIARRRLRAALIIFGLTLSTTIAGSAFGTGDTMAHALHILVERGLGSVDQVIVLNQRRARLFERLKALAEPGFSALATAAPPFFPASEAGRLAEATRGSAAISGILPAIIDQVSIVHGASQRVHTDIPLLAVATPPVRAFGVLETQAQVGSGSPIVLEALAENEIVLNAAAADAFGASTGQSLTILHDGRPWQVRIQAVSQNGGLVGMSPLIVVPLAHYQALANHSGEVNYLLVANGAGEAPSRQSVQRSEVATTELRRVLIDPAVAHQLHDLLARPDIQRGLRQAAGAVEGRDREALAALRTEAAEPALTERFMSLVSDPRTRAQLVLLARNIPDWQERWSTLRLLETVTTLTVLPVKQEALDQAKEFGSVITTLFLVLGIFSVAAAILLIFLIFELLAVDRGAELATMRALGMRRGQIMGMFLVEGLVYDLLGAALGTLISVGISYLLVKALAQALEPLGVDTLSKTSLPFVEPSSLLIAFCGGVLLTFTIMLLAAWRVSRTEIVAGTRGDRVVENTRGSLWFGMLLLLAAGLIWWRWRVPASIYESRHPLVVPSTLSFALLGMSCAVRGIGNLGNREQGTGNRGAPIRTSELRTPLSPVPCSLALIAAIWIRVLLQLPSPDGNRQTDAIALAIGGLVTIVVATVLAAPALSRLLRALDRALSSAGRLRAIVRPAAAYLGQQLWRTRLASGMFGLVVFVMVVALTLIHVVGNAYGADQPPVAGYDLLAELGDAGSAVDLEAELQHASAVSRDAFTAIGGVASAEVEMVRLGLPRAKWQQTALAIADDGFLRPQDASAQVRLDRRAGEYRDEAAAWAALQERPGTAIVTAQTASDRSGEDTTQAGSRSAPFHPFTVWIRPTNGGQPIKLTVIGVVDARSALPDGIYLSRATAAGLGVPAPRARTYYLAVRPGVRLNDAAEGLRLSFGDRGMVVTTLGASLQVVQSVRLLLVRLVQGFMGLGLIAGVAALGLLGAQSVLERRQQLAALRALGFTGRQVRAMLLFESTAIAVLGLVLGVSLGLVLARSLVAVLATGAPELRYVVPWKEIAMTIAMAFAGSTLAISLAAIQAGRVPPAEALRTV
jgi:putative ABC transport system permease protein